jgi:hypothetical protein
MRKQLSPSLREPTISISKPITALFLTILPTGLTLPFAPGASQKCAQTDYKHTCRPNNRLSLAHNRATGAVNMVSEPRWKTRAFAMKLSWRNFLVGALCGAIVMAVVGAAWLRWKPVHVRSAQDEDTYDRCLLSQDGNKVVCDALMRVLDRERVEAKMKRDAQLLLAGGFTKCEVVKWGYQNGFVASQMSEVVGISLQDASKC